MTAPSTPATIPAPPPADRPTDTRRDRRRRWREWLASLARGEHDPELRAHVELLERRRFFRRLLLVADGREHTIEYRGFGFGYESVLVDDEEAVRERAVSSMAERLIFSIGPHAASVEIEAGLGPNLFAFLWPGDVQMFLFTLNGHALYADGPALRRAQRRARKADVKTRP